MQPTRSFWFRTVCCYTAIRATAGARVDEWLNAHEDILQCVETLRTVSSSDGSELDSTMVRLVELTDVFFCTERRLIDACSSITPDEQRALGKRMIGQRKKIAGSVEDLEGRS